MLKSELKALERVFSAEIQGRLLQSKAAVYKRLADMGHVTMACEVMGHDRFGPIEVTGWALTHKGRIAYCGSC